MHLAHYTTCVYAGCSTTACVHQDLCQEIKIKCRFSMSGQYIYYPWPSIYWKHYDSALQYHLKAINGTILRYGNERKNSTLREKLLWKNYSLHIESASLCPLNLNTVFSPQALPLFDEEPHYLPYMSLPLVED